MTGWYRRRCVRKTEGTAQADSGGDDKGNWLGDEERGGSRKEAEGGESVEGERWEDSKGWKRDGDWRVGDTGRAREEKGEYNMAGVEARMRKTERKLGEKVLRGKKREREMAK